MEKIKLEILGLTPSQSQQGSFALILAEENGHRRLPIVIGVFEAQAIAIELEQIKPNRPMTHDLFKSFSEAFDFHVQEIVITHLEEGIFYAKILCTDGIRQKNIDCRPSDAVAIGLRFNAPIYASSGVMESMGISTQEEDVQVEEEFIPAPRDGGLKAKSLDELKQLLNETLANEEYELAAKIRDEIEKRN